MGKIVPLIGQLQWHNIKIREIDENTARQGFIKEFHDSSFLYVCAIYYLILIQAPQGGVKKVNEGRNHNLK